MVAVGIALADDRNFGELHLLNNTQPYPDIVDVVFDTPVDEVGPHLDGLLQAELAGSEEPQQVSIVIDAGVQAHVADVLAELV